MFEKVIPVLHNVTSSQKVNEAAKLVYGLQFKNFVVTKAGGSAAQIGVPEAQKLALKMGRNFFYLSDLDDVIELFKPEKVLTIVPKKYTNTSLENVLDKMKKNSTIVVVFGGLEPGLSKVDMSKGIATYPPGIEENIGTIGLMAITLYILITKYFAYYKPPCSR